MWELLQCKIFSYFSAKNTTVFGYKVVKYLTIARLANDALNNWAQIFSFLFNILKYVLFRKTSSSWMAVDFIPVRDISNH